MSANRTCPPIEELLLLLEAGDEDALAHVAECPFCSGLREEHRQLEKDLFRLVDPLPPSTLVSQVMARVHAAPAHSGLELRTGLGILSAAVALSVACFWAAHGRLGAVGSSVASNVVSWRAVLGALGNAMAVVWHAAAAPLTVALTVTLFAVLVGLRRLEAQQRRAGVEVSG